MRENALRQARYKAGNPLDEVEFEIGSKSAGEKKHQAQATVLCAKKDFFGREVSVIITSDNNGTAAKPKTKKEENKVWVTFHEGFSDAVRKPITVEELMRGL